MDIEGQPMLLRQLKRLRNGLKIAKPIVATSDDTSDDPIEHLCKSNDFECFRGPLDDVMLRFILCGQKFGLHHIIRVCGDSPLVDPDCCNRLVDMQIGEQLDLIYASNRAGWPYGCSADLINRNALERIHQNAPEAFYREHTIPYFFDHMSEFKVLKAIAPQELNRPDYCFAVDYPEDLELIREIFKRLKREGDYFPLASVIDLIDQNQEIRNMNKPLHSGFAR